MNIMKKLILSFLSVILLLALISSITYFQFNRIDTSYYETIEENTEKVKFITYSLMENYKEQLALRTFLITGNPEELEEYAGARERFQQNIEEIRALATTSEANKLIDELVAAEEKYNLLAEEMIAAKQIDDVNEYTRIMAGDASKARENIWQLAKNLLFYQQDHFKGTSDHLSKETKMTTNIVLWISIVAILIGIGVAILISLRISGRVNILAKAASEIADGNLSIEKINFKTKDEIGQLAQAFNKMTENLRNIIQKVGHTSEQVAASSEQLLASAEESTAATNQVATSIASVANNVEVQKKSTEESAQGIGEITAGISAFTENIATAATIFSETTKQANMGNENMKNVVKQMDTIAKASAQTNQVIQELEKRSSEIDNIIEVITSIAEQTNLLALNAAIESARAGEHGKGFAVVANEVRKLAEQSRESATQISEIIKFIQADTMKAAELMENGTTEVTNGLKLAEETGQMFERILSTIEHTNAKSQEVSAISEDIAANVKHVNTSVAKVSELAKVSTDNAREIAAVAEEQLAATEEVSNAATALANMAEELRSMVNKFKVN